MSTGAIIAIVVTLVVVVPIVLSAILYSLVLGFGGTHADTPASVLTKSRVTNGFRFTFGAVSATNVYWSDVAIVLDDGVQTCEWQPSTDSLDEGSLDTQSFGIVPLGALMIYCNVTDLAGDGHVSYGDYFTLTTPSTSPFNVTTNYTVTILFELSGGCVCRSEFSG